MNNTITTMKTIMFVETSDNEGRMVVGFQLNKENFYRVPKGKIRIARFEYMFCPDNNFGYYGDIYMKKFIRKWKKIAKEETQRIKDRLIAKNVLEHLFCYDIYNEIIEFI